MIEGRDTLGRIQTKKKTYLIRQLQCIERPVFNLRVLHRNVTVLHNEIHIVCSKIK